MTESVNSSAAIPQAEENRDITPEQTEIFIPVKYNKQIMNLDVAKAGELAQKGLKFESICEDFEELKKMALQKGKSVSEFIAELKTQNYNTKKQQLTEKCGGDGALAEHILELEDNKGSEIRGFEELKEKFPKFKTLDSLPESVLENAKLKGSLLLDEYLRYKLNEEIAVRNNISKQNSAKNSSVGSQLTKRGIDNPETAEFLKGLWNK